MRLVSCGALVAIAGLAGCAALTGLNDYSEGPACSGAACDASVQPPPPDATVDAPAPDAGDDMAQVPTADGGCPGAGCTTCQPSCAAGQACVAGVCVDVGDAAFPCPDAGCPNSAATTFSCPFGTCNATDNKCTEQGGCFCSSDTQCTSGKCVLVHGENDISCNGHCTGSGAHDGFDCKLQSPGIPVPSGATYNCPANSGFKSTTLTCDSSHTSCYCTADNQCTSGKCVPSSNNNNCSGAGPCGGSGSADFRGCAPIAALPDCPIYIGCPNNSVCSYPTCYCNSDAACASGHCIPSSHNSNCSGCTGKGTDDGHGCQPAPSSIACGTSGGGGCSTTLTPSPVQNAAHTACLCVANSNCPSGKCVNADNQCSGSACTGAGDADGQDCRTSQSIANAWACSLGKCSTLTSPTGTCAAAGVPCWCASDADCGSGHCVAWAGCAQGACTGTGTGNAFHCVP